MQPPIIKHIRMPDELLGFTDGQTTIWLDHELTAVERRVVLDHEMTHYIRGHTGHCRVIVEQRIDRQVACGLVDVDELGEAAAWSPYPMEIAEELDVMPETITSRLEALTPAERAMLEARLMDAWWQ